MATIEVSGTHRQAGQQIGEHMKLQIQLMIARLRQLCPKHARNLFVSRIATKRTRRRLAPPCQGTAGNFEFTQFL
jgi:hypothetical protein